MRNILNRILFKLSNLSCTLGKNVRISRKIVAGYNCKIGDNSRLYKTVSLGRKVIVGENSRLSKISIGDFSVIESNVKVVGTSKGSIRIGMHCYIGLNNVLDSSDDIFVADYVHIAGPSTALWCHSSVKMCLNSIPVNDKKRAAFRPTSPISIENNVYIGGNCTIYPGVTIGHHSIVAPNSAVTKSFPPYSFIGGVPAKRIKKVEF